MKRGQDPGLLGQRSGQMLSRTSRCPRKVQEEIKDFQEIQRRNHTPNPRTSRGGQNCIAGTKQKSGGWEVAEIDPEDLWNPDELRKTLGIPPQRVGKTTGWGLDKIFNFFREIETEVNAPLDTPADILKLKKAPVLLVLDEAQHLGEDGGVPEEHRKSVRTLLKRIHNGRLGKPVVLLAGGLGMAFQALGISRMAEGCKFNMEPLEEGEERDVIKDWLKKGAFNKFSGGNLKLSGGFNEFRIRWLLSFARRFCTHSYPFRHPSQSYESRHQAHEQDLWSGRSVDDFSDHLQGEREGGGGSRRVCGGGVLALPHLWTVMSRV